VNAGSELTTFREFDERHGVPKGTAFRLFKRLAPGLREGRDFWCCDGRTDPAAFARVAREHRLYAGTINAVLLGEAACRAMADALAAAGGRGPPGSQGA
jgi:hypothetical protein